LEKTKRYILSLLTGVSAVVLVLSAIAAVVLNSGMLDRYAKERITTLFNDEYLGRLELREVQLHFPNRVTLLKPEIYEPGSRVPALAAEKIRLRFNFLMLLQPEITRLSFRRISADSLNASIIERADGKKNLEVIFTSRKPDSTKTPFESFFCKKLNIANGSASWTKESPGKAPLRYNAKKIALKLTGFRVKEQLLSGVLEETAFSLPDNRFSLREGSGKFHFSTSRSELLAFKAKSGKSNAELSITLNDFNIFRPDTIRLLLERLSASRSFVNIADLNLHTDELKVFFPTLKLPEGFYTIKGNAKAADGTLSLLDSKLSRGKSRLALSGEIRNLQKKNDLSFNAVCDSSRIETEFLKAILTEETHEEFAERLGTIEFLGKAKGTLKKADTDFTLITGIGKASLKAEAAGDPEKRIAWKGTFAIDDLEPYRLFETSEKDNRKSLITAAGNVDGVSDGFKSIESVSLSARLKNSFWRQQEIKDGTVSLDYKRSLLKTTVLLMNNGEQLDASGDIDFSSEVPRYRADGSMKKLNLAKAFASRDFITDLNGTFALKGEGFDARTLNAALAARFKPSTINRFRFRDNAEITAAITQREHSSLVSLKSDFLDITLSGDYALKQLVAVIQMTGNGFAREIRTQSLWNTGLTSGPAPEGLSAAQPVRISYMVDVKDVAPLAVLLPVKDITLQGRSEGELLYRNGMCSLNSSFDIRSFTGSNGSALGNVTATAAAECSSTGVPKAVLKGKAATLSIAGVKSRNLVFDAAYIPAQLTASLDGELPEQGWILAASFSAKRNGSSYNIALNRFSAGNGGSRWQSVSASPVVITSSSALFNRFAIAKGKQQIVLDGELSSSKAGTFQCTLSNIDLAGFNGKTSSASSAKLSGSMNGTLVVSGSPGAKTSTLNLSGKRVRYDSMVIGSMQCDARHSGSKLTFDFRSSIPPASDAGSGRSPLLSVNTIEGSGTVPLHLVYFPLHVGIPEQQSISASFRSDNLSAQFLEYVLPFFENAEGIIPTTLTIGGKTPKPDIYLTSSLKDTKVTVEPTQVSYLLNGDVEVNPRQIELKNIRIRDMRNGTGRINGIIRLVKLEPKTLALEASCSKLLLFDKKDSKDETSFGTITGSSRNMSLQGDLSSPVVEGGMFIDNADFSLYRAGANESAKYIGVEKFIEFVPRYPVISSDDSPQESSERPAEFYYSLLDILQIRELKLSGAEPLKYTVIFDRIRGEQLETSISNLSLIVNKSNQNYRLYGSVNITGGKYRFSNTNFDLEDGGKITWNNSEIRDGQMDNLYGSKYISATNTQTGERDNVRLLLAITGSLNEPRVAMGYYLNEQMQPYASQSMLGGKPSQIDPNAELNVISMLLSKQWYAAPGSSGQYGNIAVSSAGLSAGAGLISSQISRIVQNIAGIESFNVNVGVDNKGALSGLDLSFALSVPGTNGKVRFVGTGSSPDIKDKALFNYYGTSQKIEYRVTPKIYVEAYRSYGQNGSAASNTNLQKPSETWGASVSYRERFHSWDQFWKRVKPSSAEKK